MALRSTLRQLEAHLSPAPTAAAATAPPAPWWNGPANTKRTYTHPLGDDIESFAPGRGLPTLVVR